MALINPARPGIWHGGDYNPEQWLHDPQVFEDDLRLMKASGCTVMSVGIFAWAALEPEEGRFEFAWLDRVFDRFEAEGLSIDLATPSGARPRWLADRYPEVLRVDEARRRHRCGIRHNHCPTSPAYRRLTARINGELARRYGRRKALVSWHVSNEYNGECHCDLCQQAFRGFLRDRYGSLDGLNHAWWTSFWSRTYTAWEQVESSSSTGEGGLNGLYIDWRRFITAQTIAFMENETAPLREHAPGIPVTTNLMGHQPMELDLHALCRRVDFASWDAYPAWGAPEGDAETAQYTGMLHDLTRSFRRGRPFLLMESSPGASNWKGIAKQKRPGVHRLASLLAVASGADGVLYFQWRKGRGGCEKHLGAVVGHDGDAGTRIFREVAELGASLARLAPVAGSLVEAPVAIIADWQNWWSHHDAWLVRRDRRAYWDCIRDHHRPFFEAGVSTDLVSADDDLAGYRLVVAPMLYQVRPGVAERLDAFVRAGGTLVLTFASGIAGADDLCLTETAPGPLRALAGLRVEELDALFPGDQAEVVCEPGNPLGLEGRLPVGAYNEVVHLEGARVLATHGQDYYQGCPAITVHQVGAGRVYYLATDLAADGLRRFHRAVQRDLALPRALAAELPEGVVARRRQSFLFLLNTRDGASTVDLGPGRYRDLDSGAVLSGPIDLPARSALVLDGQG